GMASMGRIHEVLAAQPEITDDAVAPELTGAVEIAGNIEFRNLSFSYNGVPVLRDINLRIPAGSSLAIVGLTGSGKTTVVILIPPVFDIGNPEIGTPDIRNQNVRETDIRDAVTQDATAGGNGAGAAAQSGSLLLDGRPLRQYPLETLRRSIGFVPQETFLFSDTVRENIAFGVPGASDEQVRSAAQAASIAADIESFPAQYATLVGERGITLSGGQKQRTAIARAIIRDPRILILDDALSSVDTYTEEKILNHLREVMHGRTTIFI